MSGHHYGEDPQRVPCPYCGSDDTEAEYTDVGVGMVQTAGHRCFDCHAHEMGQEAYKEWPSFEYRDDISETAKRTGWYEPAKI